MPDVKERTAIQIASELLARLKIQAEHEGREVQTLIDEALRKYLEQRQQATLTPEIMTAFKQSLVKYDELYRRLA